MKYFQFLLIIIFIIYGYNSLGQVTIKPDSLDAIIENYIKQNQIPGFVACIVKNESVIWSNAYGKANLETDKAMTSGAIMNIASISKTFTATAIMQLYEKGLINLDVDINTYLPFKVRNPNYPEIPITTRQLLTHTSSIIDGPTYEKSYACGDPNISLEYWIQNYLIETGEYYNPIKNFGDWQPGEKRVYSNVPFGLIGCMVEKITKIPFSEYCNQSIFIPLSMHHTGWFLKDVDTANLITPYVLIPYSNLDKRLCNQSNPNHHNHQSLCFYSFPNYPDGLVRTSVNDLSNYLIAMINGGVYQNRRILNQSTINMMLTLQLKDNNGQGLCWDKNEFESLWGHGGGDPGIRTFLFFNQDTKIGVITFQNSDNGNSFEIVQKLYKITDQGKNKAWE